MKKFLGRKKGSISSASSISNHSSATTSSGASTISGSGIATPTNTSSNQPDAMDIDGSTLSPSVIMTPTATLSIADTEITASAPSTIAEVQLSTLSTTLENGVSRTLVSLTPPNSPSRQPVTLMCVIDVSGSMATTVDIKTNENGVETTENDGLSVLDIVKHAMRTIIASLGPKDKLGIVTFSDAAKLEMELTSMTESGKKKAGEVVEKMKVLGMTNLWDGIKTGLNELSKEKDRGKRGGLHDCVASVFVLTDGLPNVEPPRGSVAMLKSYFDGHEEVRGVSVSMFGFGYWLDSRMLLELAEVGRGGFVFIPDAGMVGTAFINALANTFVTMGVNAVLSVELEEGIELVSQGKRLRTVDGLDLDVPGLYATGDTEEDEWALGGYECTKTSWGIQVYLGSIQYGQSKDVVLELTGPGIKEGKPFVNLKLTYELCFPVGSRTSSLEGVTYPPQPATQDALSLISYHNSRLMTVDTLRTILRTKPKGPGIWDFKDKQTVTKPNSDEPSKFNRYLTTTAIEPIKASPSASSPPTKALLVDLTGQFILAVSKEDFFTKWGRHHLRSLSRAHLSQICSNFKDPGIQLYGGPTFRTLREKLDVIFDELPPPKPSRPPPASSSSRGSVGSGTTRGLPLKMSKYNRSCAPCFAGDGVVRLADGTEKLVRDVRKGDQLAGACLDGSFKARGVGVVRCILVTRIKEGEADLICLSSPMQSDSQDQQGGFKITPYHPVYSPAYAAWKFPVDLGEVKRVPCDRVYSFLLEKDEAGEQGADGHVVVINGVVCVTLGCGLKEIDEGDVRGHPFLADYEKVVAALRGVDKGGFENGVVECAGLRGCGREIEGSVEVRDRVLAL